MLVAPEDLTETADIAYMSHGKALHGSKQADECRTAILTAFDADKVWDTGGRKGVRAANRLGGWDALYDKLIADLLGRFGICVVLEHNGFVGRGVFVEVQRMDKAGVPVYVFRKGKFGRVSQAEVVDPDDWTYRFGRLSVDKGDPK
jgi:hypothetical protein